MTIKNGINYTVVTERIVLVCSIKYVVTMTKEFAYSSDRQLDDISQSGNTVLHENVYIRKINPRKNTINPGNFTKRSSELQERVINSKKRSHCHLFFGRM